MSDRIPAEAFPPGEYLKDELEERGWTQEELASIIGRPTAVINQIISGKRGISPDTAREIAAALGTSAIYWMNLEAAYRLWQAGPVPERISHAGRLRSKFPVREMIKRGWIQDSENPQVLEKRVFDFYGISSEDEAPRLAHAAKRTGYPDDIGPIQRAWLFRVKQIAEAMTVRPYSEQRLRNACANDLKALRVSTDGIRQVPKVLADCGVRLAIVEPMSGSKIDGVTFWLDEKATRPVVGLSLRLDRIDNFWFVLAHELMHVLHKHGRTQAIIDADAMEHVSAGGSVSEEENVANTGAAEFCVARAEMKDFILRNKPLFSEEKVAGFARHMQVHPGLVVGQLQNALKNYTLFRKYLVGVRSIIAPVAMTDRYGQVIPLGS